MKPDEYLSLPYKFFVIPDSELGGYTAGIEEFPGCIAEGDTAEEALRELHDNAIDWIEEEIEAGRSIPEPSILHAPTFSGRFTLRLPPDVHRKIARWADRNNVSLNRAVETAVAYFLGAKETRPEIRILDSPTTWGPSNQVSKGKYQVVHSEQYGETSSVNMFVVKN